MKIWKRLLALLGADPAGQRTFTLDAGLEQSLRLLAEEEHRRPDQVAANLIHAALDERRQQHEYWQRWKLLTPREQEVAALVCLNYTTRQIAGRLTIATDTVKTHVRNILAKFGVRSRVELRELLDSWDFSDWA